MREMVFLIPQSGSMAQQFGSMVLFTVIMFVFFLFFSKYLMYKMIFEMEGIAAILEGYVKDAVAVIVKTSGEKGKPNVDPKEAVEDMMEFFIIPPVDLDPYGILRKLEHLLDEGEAQFEEAAAKIAPASDEVWRAHIISLLKGGVGLNTMAKIVRHYVEFVKKTGNLQLAMLFQMNMPIIKKVAKAQMDGVKAIAEGKPLGDSIAPLVVANLMDKEVHEIAKGVVFCETSIEDRRVYIIKAKGPGANLGKIGDAVKKLSEDGVAKIITVDASLKLEGEKSGKVIHGIGAAIGGFGTEKAKMEEIAVEKKIPIEAYAIKMSIEEAISPLTKDIGASVEDALKKIRASIAASPDGRGVVLVGVGNTCGIGNSKESIKDLKLPEKEEEKEEVGISDRIVKKLLRPRPIEKPGEKGTQDKSKDKGKA